eukprot:3669259-Rhodomonas_salina.2
MPGSTKVRTLCRACVSLGCSVLTRANGDASALQSTSPMGSLPTLVSVSVSVSARLRWCVRR